MGDLKIYDSFSSYESDKSNITAPQLSYVEDINKCFFTHMNYMVVTYNAKSITENTRILGEDFNISQVSVMMVDGKKIENPVKEYQFTTLGIHKVRVIFNETFTDATDILYDTPCYVDKYIDNVNLDAITVNKDHLINGGGAINYFIATYNVTSTTYTQLLGTTFDKTQIQKMYIDNVKDWQIVKEYTFNTTGKHTVMFVMKNNFNSCEDMFTACNELISLDVSNFDTSNVVNMNSMFNGCHELTSLDVSNFNTSNVTDMENMFADCRSLTSLDLSDFDTSKVTNMWQMFSYCSELTSVTMINSIAVLTSVTNMFSGITTTGTFYYNGEYDYSKIIAVLPSTWTAVNLNAPILTNFITATYTPTSTTAKTKLIASSYVSNGFIKELYINDVKQNTITHEYQFTSTTPQKVQYVFDYENLTSTYQLFSGCTRLTSIDVSNFDTSKVIDMSYMFSNCSGLTSLDLSSFNTSAVTNMNYMFYYCSNLTSLDVSSFNTSNVTTMSTMFCYCSGLTSLNISNFNTSNVTNMYSTFSYCRKLTSLDLSNFDTSNVTTMSQMFYYCGNLTSLDVSNFDTSKVTDMRYMFYECKGLTSLDLSNFDTSKVTSMSYMFDGCSGLTSLNVSNFDTSKVTTMNYMFAYCTNLTSLDLSNFDTSNVTTMNQMFYNCSKLTSVTLIYNVSKVTNVANMFGNITTTGTFYYNNQYGYSQIIAVLPSTWNTVNLNDGGNYCIATYSASTTASATTLFGSSFDMDQVSELYIDGVQKPISNSYTFTSTGNHTVKIVMGLIFTNASDMFNNCKNLKSLDVSNFDTSNVTDMEGMFLGCGGLTSLDLTNLDTSNVTNMYQMFHYCSGLTSLDVSSFNTSNVTSMYGMFGKCMGLTTLDISNFDTSNVRDADEMLYYCNKLKVLKISNLKTSLEYGYADAFVNTSALTTVYHDGLADSSWAILSKNSSYLANAEFIPALKTFNEEPYLNYTISVNTTGSDIKLLGARGITSHLEIKINNTMQALTGLTYNFTSIGTYDVVAYKPTDLSLISTRSMFESCSGLTSLDLSNLDTSNITTMYYMFGYCTNLTSLNVSSFDTSNVTDMRYMFYECEKLTSLDISNFNTSNVTSMNSMFSACSGLTSLNVSSFDTSNVTSMGYMFSGCYKLKSLDLSNFNTSNVTYMGYMFSSSSGLTSLDLSSFNTSNVTGMSNMFSSCSGLTSLDLSSFNTSNVTYMDYMFSGCSKLTTFNTNYINATKATTMDSMFTNCKSITGMMLSGLYEVTDMDYMFSGCSSLQEVVLYGEPLAVTTATSMFSGVKSGGAITYFKNYISSVVVNQIPSSWTKNEV